MMDPWVLLWVTFSLLALSVLAPIVFWAARSKQFHELDRARYLALGPEAVAARERELMTESPGPPPGKEDHRVSA